MVRASSILAVMIVVVMIVIAAFLVLPAVDTSDEVPITTTSVEYDAENATFAETGTGDGTDEPTEPLTLGTLSVTMSAANTDGSETAFTGTTTFAVFVGTKAIDHLYFAVRWNAEYDMGVDSSSSLRLDLYEYTQGSTCCEGLTNALTVTQGLAAQVTPGTSGYLTIAEMLTPAQGALSNVQPDRLHHIRYTLTLVLNLPGVQDPRVFEFTLTPPVLLQATTDGGGGGGGTQPPKQIAIAPYGSKRFTLREM